MNLAAVLEKLHTIIMPHEDDRMTRKVIIVKKGRKTGTDHGNVTFVRKIKKAVIVRMCRSKSVVLY